MIDIFSSQRFLPGPLIKLHLYVTRHRVSKKRTAMQKKTNNPVYNEAFTFKISADALPKVLFKFVVINKTSHGQDDVIGQVSLGQHVTGSGFSHWNHMLASPRKPVAMWHNIMRTWLPRGAWICGSNHRKGKFDFVDSELPSSGRGVNNKVVLNLKRQWTIA